MEDVIKVPNQNKPKLEPIPQNIVYTTDLSLISSMDWKDWCIHLLCKYGSIGVIFKGEPINMVAGDLFVMHLPELVSIMLPGPQGCQLEAVIGPNIFLQNQLPTNNYGVYGSIRLFENPIMHLTETEMRAISEDFYRIGQRVKDTGHPLFYEMIGSLCLTMMYDIFAAHAHINTTQPTNVQPLTLLSRYKAMLDSGEARRHRTAAYYAERLNVSPKYLSNTIRRLTGQNVTNLISRYADPILIEYLRNTNLSLTQVCEEMGFNSLSYFTRYVVKHLGMTPTEFRNTLR